jgi:hypothetical protein
MSLALLAAAALSTARAEPVLLTPGIHMADEVPVAATADAGGGWYALVESEDGYRIERARVSATPMRHPLAEVDAVRIDTDLASTPLFLVRGIHSLRPGAAPTTYAGGRALVAGTFQTIGYASDGITVLAAADADGLTDGDLVDPTAPVGLELHRYGVGPDGMPTEAPVWSQDLGPAAGLAHVLWAGDLDADGRPDLLLDTTAEDGSTEARLLLSGPGGGDGTLAEVAVLATTGC